MFGLTVLMPQSENMQENTRDAQLLYTAFTAAADMSESCDGQNAWFAAPKVESPGARSYEAKIMAHGSQHRQQVNQHMVYVRGTAEDVRGRVERCGYSGKLTDHGIFVYDTKKAEGKGVWLVSWDAKVLVKIVSALGRDAMILESSNAVHTIGLRCAVHTLRIGDSSGNQALTVRSNGETRQSRQLLLYLNS